MDRKYVLSTLTPLVLVLLVTSILVFSLVFISSISSAIDRMIVLLGSSSLVSESRIDKSFLPSGSHIDEVRRGEGILYSENSESLVYMKGVDEDYFNEERRIGLNLSIGFFEGNWILLSKNLASALGVAQGEKMTLLLYQDDIGRTRPFLVTVSGVFDSGYAQLDRYLAYVDISMIESKSESYEVLLPSNLDVDKVEHELESKGYEIKNYKDEYSSFYANVQQSIGILYIILVAVALLSAFFSVDVAQVYLSRDRSDIALMRLLGLGRRRILSIYLRLTIISVFFASLLGIAIGIILGYLSPLIVKIISRFEPMMMEYYISSFSVKIPFLSIFLMVLLMLFFAFISLAVSLSRTERDELLLLVNNV